MTTPDDNEKLVRSMRPLLRTGQALLVLATFGFMVPSRVPNAISVALLVLGAALGGTAIFKLMQAKRAQR